jgi:hypothetical protein
MEPDNFFADDFEDAVIAAIDHARRETLAAGVPIFYLDREHNLNIMEHPDGRKFEVRFIPGAPGDKNYEILRELVQTAA